MLGLNSLIALTQVTKWGSGLGLIPSGLCHQVMGWMEGLLVLKSHPISQVRKLSQRRLTGSAVWWIPALAWDVQSTEMASLPATSNPGVWGQGQAPIHSGTLRRPWALLLSLTSQPPGPRASM